MRKPRIDYDQQLPVKYTTTPKKAEYLIRSAANAGHGNVNQIIDDLIFNRPRRPWQKHLEEMRAAHRKLGLPDREFFHATIKRKLGLKVRRGRRRRILFDAK